MSSYAPALKESLKARGLDKTIGELLEITGTINKKSSGQVIAHINSGGVTQITLNNWKINSDSIGER